MCGLAGLWRPTPIPASELQAQASAMAAAIARRGPDDAGVWAEPEAGLALAHRRLAVLDLSPAGHQPMASASGRYVIAFNGEIYNHRELRRELEQRSPVGQAWRGHSDTETLLAAIEAWGLPATLERASGMAALALWDRQERRLQLARDRFGEKPLTWGWLSTSSGPALVFGSELAALRALPGAVMPPLDPNAAAAFFRHGCIPAPLCIHQGLQQLPPGHLVAITHPRQPLPVPELWWDLQAEARRAAAEPISNEAEALDALETTLQQAVTRQSLADVPLGSFLSGGIDSSLVTALLQAGSPRPVRSFTISFPDQPGFNEAPQARAVAAHLGTEHTEIALSAADTQALIPQLPRLWSEPFADSSAIPTHLVCREARRSGLTVALSGDGGDELFGGYNRHRLAPLLQRRLGPLPAPLRRALAAAATAGLAALPAGAGLGRHKAQKLIAALGAAGSLEQLHAALSTIGPASGPASAWRPAPLPAAATAAERLMLADALTYLPADILTKLDRAAMAVGLETRAPFLDPAVAQLAWRLPLALKIRGGQGKWILRQLLARYLPGELVERPKAGFALPLGPWLRGSLRPWTEELLDPQLLSRQGWLRPEPIQHLWRQHQAGRADHTPRLWVVLMWQAWLLEWG